MGMIQTLRNFTAGLRVISSVGKSSTTRTYKLTDPILKKIFAQDDGQTLSDPYSQLAAVYACINAKARNIAQVPFDISREGSDEALTSGPIVDLFRRPNPWMSNTQLWEAVVISLETAGEWFCIEDDETSRDGIPAYLWVYNPDDMSPAHTTAGGTQGPMVGWWHKVKGERKFIATDQVLFDKYWNPRDPVRGLSPLRAARLTTESNFDALRYNRNFFKNDATPPVVFKWTDTLTDDQFRTEQERLINSRKGVEKAHSALLLDGGASVEKLGINQKDMEFLGQLKNSRDECCMIFQVPKSVISLYEDTNYATAQSADLSFWIRSLIPIMVRIEDTFNSMLLQPLGYHGKFNLRKVDAINNAFLSKVTAAKDLATLGFTPNELNERLDLGFDDAPWRDEPISSSMPTITVAPPAKRLRHAVRNVTPKLIPSEATEKAARAREWQALNARIMSITSGCNKELRSYYAEVESKLFRKMLKGYKSPDGTRAELKKLDTPTDAEIADLFNDDKMKRILTRWIELSMSTGISTVVGGALDMQSEEVLASIAQHVSKVTAINETAREKLVEVIRDTMKTVAERGLSEQDAADLLTDNCRSKMGEISNNARTIARTETHGAYSEARYDAMKSTQPVAKKWISSRDSLVRDQHAALDGKQVPFDDAFGNGLRYPLDPAGSAAEVINCRCVMVPIYEGDEQ